MLTFSLHKFDNEGTKAVCAHERGKRHTPFFPGSGAKTDLGEGRGRGYALNAPLMDGITDEHYLGLFVPVVTEAFRRFQPDAVVLQGGCDSIAFDRLGTFNLSIAVGRLTLKNLCCGIGGAGEALHTTRNHVLRTA